MLNPETISPTAVLELVSYYAPTYLNKY